MMRTIKQLWRWFVNLFHKEWFICCVLPCSIAALFVFRLHEFDMGSQWAGNFGDFIGGCATVVGVIIALFAYGAWRPQMKGTTSFHLARAILTDILKLEHLASAVLHGGFASNAREEIKEYKDKLYANGIEGSVIWGESFREQLNDVLIYVLLLETRIIVDDAAATRRTWEALQKNLFRLRDFLRERLN